MTNEMLVLKIQAGETDLIENLWAQVQPFTKQQASKFYHKYYDRCVLVGINFDDLQQEAFIGIYKAIAGYNADKGVKFLTYAGYHLKSRFYDAAKMHSTGWQKRQEPVSLDHDFLSSDGDEALSLLDLIADPAAEKEIDEIAERDYMTRAGAALNEALDRLPHAQRGVAVNCLGGGLSYAEYARQKGVNRASARQAGERALKALRASSVMMYSALI